MLPPAPVDAFAIGITVGSIVLLMTTISCCIGCYYGRQRHKAMDLHRAVEAGMRSEVERLLKEEDAPVNYAFNDAWTPLHLAADANRQDIAAVLLAAGADKAARDCDGKRPFERARKDAAFRRRLGGGSLELHHAAAKGDVTEIEAKLREGEEVDGTDVLGRTALHGAAAAANIEAVRALLSAKAPRHRSRFPDQLLGRDVPGLAR